MPSTDLPMDERAFAPKMRAKRRGYLLLARVSTRFNQAGASVSVERRLVEIRLGAIERCPHASQFTGCTACARPAAEADAAALSNDRYDEGTRPHQRPANTTQ